MQQRLRVHLFSFRLQGGKSLDYQLKLSSQPRNPPPDFLIWIWAWVSVHQVMLLSHFLSVSVVVWYLFPVTWAPMYFIKVPSRFVSATSLTSLKDTGPARWEKVFKRECLCPGKIQPLFLFVSDLLKGRTEKRECVHQWCWKFVTLETRDPAWMNPTHPWPGRTVYQKKKAKLI